MEAPPSGSGRAVQKVERDSSTRRSSNQSGLLIRGCALPVGARDLAKQSALLYQSSNGNDPLGSPGYGSAVQKHHRVQQGQLIS